MLSPEYKIEIVKSLDSDSFGVFFNGELLDHIWISRERTQDCGCRPDCPGREIRPMHPFTRTTSMGTRSYATLRDAVTAVLQSVSWGADAAL